MEHTHTYTQQTHTHVTPTVTDVPIHTPHWTGDSGAVVAMDTQREVTKGTQREVTKGLQEVANQEGDSKSLFGLILFAYSEMQIHILPV